MPVRSSKGAKGDRRIFPALHPAREKPVKYREDILDGLENAPKAFIRMFQGRNIGKQLVKAG